MSSRFIKTEKCVSAITYLFIRVILLYYCLRNIPNTIIVEYLRRISFVNMVKEDNPDIIRV